MYRIRQLPQSKADVYSPFPHRTDQRSGCLKENLESSRDFLILHKWVHKRAQAYGRVFWNRTLVRPVCTRTASDFSFSVIRNTHVWTPLNAVNKWKCVKALLHTCLYACLTTKYLTLWYFALEWQFDRIVFEMGISICAGAKYRHTLLIQALLCFKLPLLI
jgi:hypothetical protein